MLRYETMRTHGYTGSRRALLLLNMHRKVIGPVALRRSEKIGCLHAKAAERAIGYIGREFVQHIQVRVHAKITDDTFEKALHALHTEATGHTLSTRLYTQIARALQRPGDHAGAGREQLNDTGTHDRARIFERVEIIGRIERGYGQGPTLCATYNDSTNLIFSTAQASVGEDIAQRSTKGHLNDDRLTIGGIIVYGQHLGATGRGGPHATESCRALANDQGHISERLHIVGHSRLIPQTILGRERWTLLRHAATALDQSHLYRLLAAHKADIGTEHIDRAAKIGAQDIAPNETSVQGLAQRCLYGLNPCAEATASKQVRLRSAYRISG